MLFISDNSLLKLRYRDICKIKSRQVRPCETTKETAAREFNPNSLQTSAPVKDSGIQFNREGVRFGSLDFAQKKCPSGLN